MQFDVFISHSSQDKAVADATCAALENAGIRCWIAPRDILPGTDWGEAIMDALESCRAMVLIFSANANNSPQIRREIERTVGRGIPIIPVRIENTTPTKAMAYFIGPVHWLDAITPPLEQHLNKLAESLRTLLAIDSRVSSDALPQQSPASPPVAAVPPPSATVVQQAVASNPLSPRRLLALKCASLIACAVSVLLGIGAILAPGMLIWLPVACGLAFVSYWLVYRNLTAQPQIARFAALICGLVYVYFVMWNASINNIALVVIEIAAAVCLLLIALELTRTKPQ